MSASAPPISWGARSPLGPAGWRDTIRAAEVHYYRVPRERWELMLLRAEQSDANIISTYVPWSHHAPQPDVLDLTGESSSRRDLVGFLRLVADRGLGMIIKPGPFVDSEILGGGVPPWLLEKHPELWVRAYDGRTMVHSDSQDPRFSYDAPDHHGMAALWLSAVMEVVLPYEGNALVAVQVDNETPGDGMLVHEFDVDPSPFRADTASPERWSAWYRSRTGSDAAPDQPVHWTPPKDTAELLLLADADRFADHQMREGLSATASALRASGYAGLLFHDWLCMRWQIGGMLIDPAVLADTCGWVGQNVYAEDVDEASMIAGTGWYRMSFEEYVHHAWWRLRLCHTLSGGRLPRLVPEISAREGFYLHCHLIGGMDAPCIYMLHTSAEEPADIGAGQRWAMEAPIGDDGIPRRHWSNMRALFLSLRAGGQDLLNAPLPAPVAIAYAHEGEHLARWAGVIPGSPWSPDDPLRKVAASANAACAGNAAAQELVKRGIEFDVVDAARDSLDGYPAVVVPSLGVLAGNAIDELARYARNGGTLVFAGEVPTFDAELNERNDLLSFTGATLSDVIADVSNSGADPMRPPRSADSGQTGVDASCRFGKNAAYLSVVNRCGADYAGTVRLANGLSVDMAADHGTVSWARIDLHGTVTAAMIDGSPGRAGGIQVDRGLAGVAHLNGAWEVITADRTKVTLPGSANEPLWRVLLDGTVVAAGVVGPDGCFETIPEDDGGQTDRYVIGPRQAAEAAAEPVLAFLASSWAQAERAMEFLAEDLRFTDDEDLADLCARLERKDLEGLRKSLARLRSRMLASSAEQDLIDAHAALNSLALRVYDLSLGRT